MKTKNITSLCSALLISLLLQGLLSINLYAQPPRRSPPTPAPVPDAVTMPRPTEAEVQKARDSLAAFLTSLDADTRRIFDSYPDLLQVTPPGVNSAIVPSLSRTFRERHEANVEVAKAGNIDVLFMGDSITDFWRSDREPYAGKPVFDRYFGNMKVANFGIAGDTTQGVLYRLQNGEGQGYSPKAVMLMIGTNNTRANSAGEIAEGVGAVVLELQKNFPEAKILLLGIFPRGNANDPVREKIADINTVIARLHDGKKVFYLDIGAVFLDEGGNIPKDVMADGLHPSTKGYELWAEAVKGPLSKLM